MRFARMPPQEISGIKKAFDDELKIDRNRDIAVEGLQKLGLTEQEQELITRAKRNSDKLVLLENQAFAAVENSDCSSRNSNCIWP